MATRPIEILLPATIDSRTTNASSSELAMSRIAFARSQSVVSIALPTILSRCSVADPAHADETSFLCRGGRLFELSRVGLAQRPAE